MIKAAKRKRTITAWALGLLFCLACAPAQKRSAAAEHVRVGHQHLADGRVAAAEAEFEKAVQLDPAAVEAHVQLANICVMRGRVAEAEERFASLLDRYPESSLVLSGWGKLLAATGRLEQAEPVLRRAVESENPSPDAAMDLATVLATLGRIEEALAAYERASDLGASTSIPFLIGWSEVLDRAGRPDDAIEKLEMSASMDPDNPEVLEGLGRAYLETGRPEEAVSILRRALAATQPGSDLYATRRQAFEKANTAVPRRRAHPTMPNVLLIVIDTLRSDHVGAYGYPYPTTANIDRLATRSVVFETAVSQAPWTAPAIASLFTGLYPSVHGLDGGIRWSEPATSNGGNLPFAVQKTLPPGHQTMAELFHRAGYTTAGFVSNLYVNAIFGFAQGFDHFDDSHEDYFFPDGEAKRRAEVTNQRVFDWLSSGVEEPWFLLVHYNDPHWPYEPPSPYGQSFTFGYNGSLTPNTTREIVVTHHEVPPPISEQDLAYIVGLYDGEIQYMDAQLGQLLEAVGGLQLKRDLVSVVTADHGEEFLDHGAFNHGYTLYEEQTSVPFIISAPSRLKPCRISQQVRLIDAAPTLLDLARIDLSGARFQGRSLLPLINGSDTDALDAFSEATNFGGQYAIRSAGSMKLIHSLASQSWLLFDLRTDPREQDDLSARHSTEVQELSSRIDAWRERNRLLHRAIGASETALDHVVLDEKTQQGLQALGYIDP